MGEVAASLVEVARRFDVAKGTVTGWRKRGCRALDRPPYDLDAVDAWRRSRAATSDSKADANAELAKWRRSRRRLSELEYSRRRGRLVERSVYETLKARLGMAVLTRFLALPRTVAPELVGVAGIAEADAIVNREVRHILTELSLMSLPDEAWSLVNQAVEIVVRSTKAGVEQQGSNNTEDASNEQ